MLFEIMFTIFTVSSEAAWNYIGPDLSGFFVLFSINAYWVQTMLEAKQVVKLAVSSVILADDFDKKKKHGILHMKNTLLWCVTWVVDRLVQVQCGNPVVRTQMYPEWGVFLPNFILFFSMLLFPPKSILIIIIIIT